MLEILAISHCPILNNVIKNLIKEENPELSLQYKGGGIKGGLVSIEGNISSQFISLN